MTSLDVLYTVLSVSIIVLTILIALLLYYFISTMHHIHQVTGRIQKTIELIERVVESVKDKISRSGNNLTLLLGLGSKLVSLIEEKRSARGETQEKQKKKRK